MNDALIRPLPRAFELVELLDRVLGEWAFLPVRPAGQPASGPAPLPLEFSSHLKGATDYLLVLRCSHEFGAELAYASTGDSDAREQGTDAVQELCNLLSSHLLTGYLGGDRGGFAPFLPVPSRPEQWPDRPADVETVVMVESFAVELRLWAGNGAGGAIQISEGSNANF
jgi:hypothetical protein